MFSEMIATMPSVSVLVPVRNEADFIERCVGAILANDYPSELVEILVIDGQSTDGTDALVAAMAHSNDRVRLLSNPEKMVSYAMNLGIREAKGRIVIRVDGHAIIKPDFIRFCVNTLCEHSEAWCVGGPLETVSTTRVGRAVASAMSSPIGVGNAMFRLCDYNGFVDTLAFGAYWRWVFDRIGGFDEELARNQDDELNLRLIQGGGRIYMHSRIRSQYFARSNFRKLAKQYFQYGFWRVRTIQKHHRPATARQVVPLVFVATYSLLLLGAFGSTFLGMIFLALNSIYVISLLAGACIASRKIGMVQVPLILWAFVLMHFGYGFGSAQGIVHFILRGRSGGHAASQSLSR